VKLENHRDISNVTVHFLFILATIWTHRGSSSTRRYNSASQRETCTRPV